VVNAHSAILIAMGATLSSKAVLIGALVASAQAFSPSFGGKVMQRQSCGLVMSDEVKTPSSPLPSFFDDLPGKKVSSPRVERALDSAMDFLSAAEDVEAKPKFRNVDEQEEEEDDEDMDFTALYSDSLDIEPNEELIAELKERDAQKELAQQNRVYAYDINHENIQKAVKKWQKHENDYGSSAVQVAVAHEKIKYLTAHLLVNKHDNSAKRGLQALVVARRRHLNFIVRSDRPLAKKLIQELGIRYRPPGRIWDKELKYGRFKNTKQGKKANKLILSKKGLKRLQARESELASQA